MITLFSTPKNFTVIYKIIQENALRSWRSLSPKIQIIIINLCILKNTLLIFYY